jgi:hypothetical protein
VHCHLPENQPNKGRIAQEVIKWLAGDWMSAIHCDAVGAWPN